MEQTKPLQPMNMIRIERWLPLLGILTIGFAIYIASKDILGAFVQNREISPTRLLNGFAVSFLVIFRPGTFILWPIIAFLNGWLFSKNGDTVRILSNSNGIVSFKIDDVAKVEYLHSNTASLLPNQLNASSAIRFNLKNKKRYSINILFPKDNFCEIAELIEITFENKVEQNVKP